ncbi:MAG TPA: TlpA disulfide reductase family protein [Chloroflexota bacterium]|nr:TlpA disulfide reductase family protein [Chloroflexota bacterium]
MKARPESTKAQRADARTPRPTPARGASSARPDVPRRPLLLPLVLVLVLLGAGLAAWHTFGPAAPSGAATGTGPVAPTIDAPTVDGGRFVLSAQRGRVVVLYAMAAWCTSCVPETTALGQLARSDGRRGVVTLLVDESPQTDTPQAVRDFRARAQGPARTWVLDQGGAIARAYGITMLDTTVVIDRSGHVAARYSGSIDLATLQSAVRPLL